MIDPIGLASTCTRPGAPSNFLFRSLSERSSRIDFATSPASRVIHSLVTHTQSTFSGLSSELYVLQAPLRLSLPWRSRCAHLERPS